MGRRPKLDEPQASPGNEVSYESWAPFTELTSFPCPLLPPAGDLGEQPHLSQLTKLLMDFSSSFLWSVPSCRCKVHRGL